MKLNILMSSSALALVAFGSSVSAQEATEASGADEARQKTVYVTATRREGTVQDVPINIAAVGGADIAEQGIEELADLISVVPGINIVDRGGRQGNPIIVRGLNADPLNSGDGDNTGGGTVATYLGEIPVFIDLKLNDMERVEVLLGPQGTLYGAGTLAGAIRYIPVKPQFDESEAEARADLYMYSEAESLSTDTGFTINHGWDNFAIRGSLDVLRDSGFIDQPVLTRTIGVSNPDPDFNDPAAVAANLRSEDDTNYEDTVSARIAARWAPTDWLDGTLTYYYQNVKVGGRSETHYPAGQYYNYAGPEALYTSVIGKYDNANRIEEPNEITNDLLALEVTADLGFAELTSATGYSRFEDDGNRDQNDLLVSLEYSYELFPAFGSITLEQGEQNIFTQEVRLVSTTDGPFNWIIGGYYSHLENDGFSKEFTPNYAEWVNDTFGPGSLTENPDDLEYYQIGHDKVEEAALFGEIGYDITEKLSVTFGARYYEYDLQSGAYTEDLYGDPNDPDDDYDTVFFPFFRSPTFTPITIGQTKDLAFDPSLAQSDDGLLYKFNAAYEFTDDILGYFTYSEGFRLGASNGIGGCAPFDPNANQGACALAPGQQYGPNPTDIAEFDERQFGPDKTKNYELGAKTSWLGGDLVLNGALFYVEWTDPQVASATVNANLPITVNAAGAESKGVELQGQWQVTDQFNLRGSYSYARSELTEDVPFLIRTITPPGFGTAFEDGKAGDRLPGSPENQFAVFGTYDMPLANGNSLKFRGGYSWQDEILTRTGGRGSSLPIPSVGIANASVTYSTDDWEASLYVKNLFDEYHITGVLGSPLSTQAVPDINGSPVTVRGPTYTLGAPQTIGVRFKYLFNNG